MKARKQASSRSKRVAKRLKCLSLLKHRFDPVARFVEVSVVRDDDFAGPVGGDDRHHPRLCDLRSQGVAVAGLVGNERGGLSAFDHGGGGDDIVDLPSRQHEADGPPKGRRAYGSSSSVRLGNAPAPESWPPFSGRRLLVGANQGRVEHEVLVVAIFDQGFEDALPDPGDRDEHVGQGDTREAGLATIIKNGGQIIRATKRYRWPNESAAVIVSIVHVQLANHVKNIVLDGAPVKRISAYLVSGEFE